MDELKLLIEMVAGLPSLAIWVLCGYLVYKIAVVGSIYGLLRFAIEKWHSVLINRRSGDVKAAIDGIVIADSMNALLAQIRRISSKNKHGKSSYIHDSAVDWLREAIDAKEALDELKKSK
jgi:uncharacterized membrane protein YhiD involved in acid resistance